MRTKLRKLVCYLFGHNYVDVVLRGAKNRIFKYQRCNTCGNIIKSEN